MLNQRNFDNGSKMEWSYITRQLYPDEQKLLKRLKAKQEKILNKKNKLNYFAVAGLIGVIATYLAYIITTDFLVFVFGTVAVISFTILISMPFQLYKNKVQLKKTCNSIDAYLEKNAVQVIPVKANRIAIAEEYEDEGDLFIVEYDTDKILYLWDHDYNMKGYFPSLTFEIYEDRYSELVYKQIYPLSAPINPIIIDKKVKWAYFKKVGVPAHLETQSISLDKLIEKYNQFA